MKATLSAQLNRISGQVKGIQNMIDNERDCLDVVQQILAARNALSKVGKEYLTKEAVRCSRSPGKKKKFDMLLKQLFVM